MTALQSVLGILAFLGVAYAVSERRRAISPRLVLTGVGLQLALALLLLKLPVLQRAFGSLNRIVATLESSTSAGAQVVFGYLAGGDLPYEEAFPGASFILAFRGLPIVLVMSALSSLLFYWKVLPWVVRGSRGSSSAP